MTSTSLKLESCLGAQILVCGQLADFTEGSTVPAARLHYEYGVTSLASATSQQFTPETAQKTLHPSRLPL